MSASEPITATSRPCVLIVDDSRVIRQMIVEYFGGNGYDVFEAADGREALERLTAVDADVIVSDIQMPNMDGWALFEEVRRKVETTDVPFVFLTVDRGLPTRLRGFRIGADDFVTKPFEVEELHLRVERLLGRTRAERRARGRDTILSGTVEHLALTDLLQLLSMNGRACVIHLRQDGREGEIHLHDREIVHAVVGRARGLKALYRLFGWTRATFRVLAAVEPTRERSIEGETSNVVMDGLVALDEWNRWRIRLPEPATVLRLTDEAGAKMKGAQVRPAEFDVLTRSRHGRSVAQILDDSPLPDGELAQAIHSLIERGVVRPGA